MSASRTETETDAETTLDDELHNLWDRMGDAHPGLVVAARHAFEDYELQPEDEAHLNSLSEIRDAYEKYAGLPDLDPGARYFIAFLGQRLMGLEGRAEICRLAAR